VCYSVAGRAGDAGGDALCATPYAGGDVLRASWLDGGVGGAGGGALCATPYAGRAGGAGGDALCATLYAKGGAMLEVVEMPEVMRCVLCLREALEMPEVVHPVLLYMLDALEVMRCVLLCMLDALEAMRCVLLCMLAVLEAMHGELLCLQEVLEALEALEVPEVMYCALLCLLEVIRCVLLCLLEDVEGGQFLGFEISIVAVFVQRHTSGYQNKNKPTSTKSLLASIIILQKSIFVSYGRTRKSNAMRICKEFGVEHLFFPITWPYHNVLRHHTLEPARRLAESATEDELRQNIDEWRATKCQELDFVKAAVGFVQHCMNLTDEV